MWCLWKNITHGSSIECFLGLMILMMKKKYSGLPVMCQAHLQGTRPEAMQQFNASAVSKWIYYTFKKNKNFGTAWHFYLKNSF